MTIPTNLSLQGYIASVPALQFGSTGTAHFHARAGIRQWRREADGAFTELDPVHCDLVLFGMRAERAYQQLRPGDEFLASGYIHQFVRERDGHSVPCEEFVAHHIGHDMRRTSYTVDRKQPEPPRATAAAADIRPLGI